MELTPDQRAKLAGIRTHNVGASYVRDLLPNAKAARRKHRAQLAALREAWDSIDPDTQTHLLAAVRSMWEDDDAWEPGVISRAINE